MCITSAAAKLSKTRILSCSLGEKHLLAYENSAANLSGMPNCMILPVPGTLTQEDFIDSTPFAKFMEELEDAWTPRSRSLGMSKGISAPVQRFSVGMYEVFLAPGTSLGFERKLVERITGKHRITEAMSQLPEDRRPNIRTDLLEWFDKTYPGWSIVCCVFESDKPMSAQPIMFTYTPFEEFKEKLFFPGVDSHDGGPPDLNERVEVDHFLFSEHASGHAHNYRATLVPEYLKATKFLGAKFSHTDTNGDWVVSKSAVNVGEQRFYDRPTIFTRTKPVT